MITESGDMVLTGRIREMINRGGECISATDMEHHLTAHPEIVAAAVVPMPDPEMGERACAYVQLAGGANLSFEKISNFLKEQGASVLLMPERIEFIDAMPYTTAEKIDKRSLSEDIQRKTQASS